MGFLLQLLLLEKVSLIFIHTNIQVTINFDSASSI
jgi:hypothetical protein